MTRHSIRAWGPLAVLLNFSLAAAFLLFLSFGAGCKSNSHTSDPQLRKIDDLLNAALPKGTPRSRVEFFLTTRGYNIEPAPNSNTVVAVVHHVDIETLQPSTARVTFHFDANDKLTSYDLQPAPEPAVVP